MRPSTENSNEKVNSDAGRIIFFLGIVVRVIEFEVVDVVVVEILNGIVVVVIVV